MVAKLRYLPDLAPGYRRVRRGRGFYYTDSDGRRITDDKKLTRFRALVIPPAWKQVWISPSKRGHLQATGVDEEGRKQYLYHPEWTKERQRKKLKRMVAFGNALPDIRRQIAKDLRVEELTKEKAIAIALKVTEETLIRIGNEQYLRKYGSRGLTTLKKSHVHISESDAVFRFRGKKGVQQEISVRNVKLVAHLLELNRLTGPYLFQYCMEGNRSCRLRAADINAYIQQHTDLKFSSKDYRTWYAGFWAFSLFGRQASCESEKERETTIVSVLDVVSHRLGNTRAVCKHYYVPDSIITAYKDGSLQPYLRNGKRSKRPLTKKETERQLLAFLACSIEEVR
ncbi:DNA topoisomerase IB [Parapedobacter indicus]|uniref:DNA topoisomerase-1 n=1 Tax=Parapedobacter indicus TaxID=1477437 RepID=A0A1I3U6J1_9SPHI|nr:DNA topoisomerase IB [Parapedobacter indicus]PPK99176.1 DNA topoisomerase-1 [Parapedobacter indicus]SFJ78630.1 DNA topoisomerase-1 [Parapedobacter indicus]